jgi:hypothetical protein
VKALQEGEKMAFHRIKPWIGILFRTGINLFCVYVAMLLAVGAASSSFFAVRVEPIVAALPLYYLLPPLFYLFLEEYNHEKKETVTVQYSQKPSFFQAFCHAASTLWFWKSALPLLILLSCLDPGNLLWIVCPAALRKWWYARLAFQLLFYWIPQNLLLLLVESMLYRDWHRQWKMNFFTREKGRANINRLPKKRLLFNLFITVFGTGIIEVFLLILVGGVLRSVFLLIVQSKTAMILALLLIGGFPAVRLFRLRSLRRRFQKRWNGPRRREGMVSVGRKSSSAMDFPAPAKENLR